MEIIDYIGSDGFVHHILSPTMGVSLFLWILIVCSSVSLIYLVLKKIIG